MLSNEKILEKAIKKAIDNGWMHDGYFHEINDIDVRGTIILTDLSGNNFVSFPYVYINGDEWHLNDIIFNHKFAKALWGEDVYVDVGFRDINKAWMTTENLPKWKYHLQQLVISEDPIQYLKENIK